MSYIPSLEGIIDSTNSSTAPLGAALSFTGASISVEEYSTVSVSVYTDQAGSFEIQFSSNGTSWDFINSYDVAASQGKAQTVRVQAAFMRVVYTNGAAPQSLFRLQTILNANKTPTELPFLGMTSNKSISTLNSSTAPLGGAATFTGDGETSIFNTLLINLTTDAAGALFVDFSPDNIAWRSTSFSGYRVEADIAIAVKDTIGDTYFRVRLVNGAAAQTTLNLVSITGSFDEEYLTTYQQIIRRNTGLEPDQNNRTSVSYIDSLTTTFQDVWGGGGVMVLPTGAETYELVSANANDTAAGTGARSVLVETLDASGIIQSQIVATNGGTATVTGTHTFPRSIIVIDSGSNQTNVGDITLQVAGGGNVRSVIIADEGLSKDSHYKVPLNAEFHITDLDYHAGVNAKQVIARSRIMLDGTNIWVSTSRLPFGEISFTRNFDEVSARFPTGTIIKYDAKVDTGSGDALAVILAGFERRIS